MMTFSLISLDGLPDAIERLSTLLAEHGVLLLAGLFVWRVGPYVVTWLRREF